MKTFTQTLMAATAMSLVLSSGAMADSNEAYIDQTGERNSALIDQSDATNSEAGAMAADFRINQSGADNAMTIMQTGDAQKAGLNTGNGATGIDQTLGRNLLSIEQSGFDNEVITVMQAGAASATDKINSASVTQSHSGNEVSIIQQTYLPGDVNTTANTITITQSGVDIVPLSTATTTETGENKIYRANQGGAGNVQTLSQTGYRNEIGNVRQNNAETGTAVGKGNTATLTQDGTGNKILKVIQDGDENTAKLNLVGTGNGRAFSPDGYATFVEEAYKSAIVQDGSTNTVDMMVTGSRTAFGFGQIGNNNSVGMVMITGDGNEIGVTQFGDRNMLDLAAISGNDNIIGLQQTGADNKAGVDISDTDGSADGNLVSITQTSTGFAGAFTNIATLTISGDTNDVTIGQTDDNTATVTITGDSNVLELSQTGTNTANVDITGDSNGNFFGSGGFDGVAGDLAADAGNGLTNGLISQDGAGNSVTFTIAAPATGTSTNNLFAFEQRGDGHSIDGTQTGSSNQVAVLQVNAAGGMGNSFSFTQTGMQNIVGGTQ